MGSPCIARFCVMIETLTKEETILTPAQLSKLSGLSGMCIRMACGSGEIPHWRDHSGMRSGHPEYRFTLTAANRYLATRPLAGVVVPQITPDLRVVAVLRSELETVE